MARLKVEDVLTEAEHRAMQLAADLWNHLCTAVVCDGRTRAADLSELAMHVHAIQNAVMAQAAARAYPTRYRMLGGHRLSEQADTVGPPVSDGTALGA